MFSADAVVVQPHLLRPVHRPLLDLLPQTVAIHAIETTVVVKLHTTF